MSKNKKSSELSFEKALNGIPKRLKAARKACGFSTRRSFALACSVPPPTYLNHEEGKSEIRVRHIVLYSTVLDISLPWLILGTGNPLDHHETPEVSKSNLFKAYMNLMEVENSTEEQ